MATNLRQYRYEHASSNSTTGNTLGTPRLHVATVDQVHPRRQFWSKDEMLALVCLHRWYNYNEEQVSRILNVFSGTGSFRVKRCSSQWRQFKGDYLTKPNSEKAQALAMVLQVPFNATVMPKHIETIISKLRWAIQQCEIPVRKRQSEPPITIGSRRGRPRSQRSVRQTRRANDTAPPQPDFERLTSIDSTTSHFLPAGMDHDHFTDEQLSTPAGTSPFLTNPEDNLFSNDNDDEAETTDDNFGKGVVDSIENLHGSMGNSFSSVLKLRSSLIEQLPRNVQHTLPLDFPTKNHADLGLPDVVFRTWTKHSAGTNSSNEFRAGQFGFPNAEIPKPPAFDDSYLIYQAAMHIGKEKAATPFVSVTPSITWVFEMAFTASKGSSYHKREPVDPREIFITVIDGSIVGRTSRAYYAKPMFEQIKKTSQLHHQRHRKYQGTFEWLVWGEISSEAITTTFSLAELIGLTNKSVSVSNILELDLFVNHSKSVYIRDRLRKRKLQLSDANEVGLAKILLFFGLTADSSSGFIKGMLYTVLQGFSIHSDIDSDDYAFDQYVFQHFRRLQTADLPTAQMDRLKYAFEAGRLDAQSDIERGYCHKLLQNLVVQSSMSTPTSGSSSKMSVRSYDTPSKCKWTTLIDLTESD